MKKLAEDIKTGKYKKLYLLYGEEEYLKNRYRDEMIKKLVPKENEMNFKKFDGERTKMSEVVDLAMTTPFFADRRIILLENTNFFKKSPDKIAEFFKRIPSTTCIIFVEKNVDKRSSAYKTVNKIGCAAEFKTQTTSTLQKWILGKVERENQKITKSAIERLLMQVGEDMETLDSELEKLFSYCMDKDGITKEDVKDIVTSYPEEKIFEMLDALSAKEQKRVLYCYHDMLALKEPPMKIFALLIRQYRILYHVKELQMERMSDKEIAKVAGIPPFTVSKYKKVTRIYTRLELLNILDEVAILDESIKRGKVKDTLAVELFLMKHSA